MSDLKLKQYVVQMLNEGFVLAPCSNEDCDNLFASNVYCVDCSLVKEN